MLKTISQIKELKSGDYRLLCSLRTVLRLLMTGLMQVSQMVSCPSFRLAPLQYKIWMYLPLMLNVEPCEEVT